jgi:hypothetical protein
LYGGTIGKKVKGIWITEKWTKGKNVVGWGSEGADGRVREINMDRKWRSGKRRRRDKERERDTRRKERKKYKRWEKEVSHPFQKTANNHCYNRPNDTQDKNQTSRNLQTFGSQSEISSTFRHWTCSLLELGSFMAVTTFAHHLHIQGENHRIRIRGWRHPACRFSSEHKSAGSMGCEHNPDIKCSKLDGKSFIQKKKSKGV